MSHIHDEYLHFIAGSMATTPSASSLVSYCLLLPGKNLHLSALLTAKKFRGKGNKDGAVAAFREIADAGLGTLSTEESRRGTSAVSGVLHCIKCTCCFTLVCHAHYIMCRAR